MQQRICDCQLRVGGCYCSLTTERDEELSTRTEQYSKISDKESK